MVIMVIEKLFNDYISEYSFILKPSNIAGVGVFAVHGIRKGIVLYKDWMTGWPRNLKIKNIPKEFQKFCVCKNTTECFCPERFDQQLIWLYANHSFQPNFTIRKTDRAFVTLRDIEPDEELVYNYNDYEEAEEAKDSFYR
jgi:SET domain-containing protein